MRGSLKASLVTSCGVFVAALLGMLFHHNVVHGRVLTPLEQLPMALIGATFFSGLAWLGTWLGLRHAKARHASPLAGLVVAVVYIVASLLANALIVMAPRTVTVPSREANFDALEGLLIAALWGIGAPYLIALLVGRRISGGEQA